MRLSRKRFDAMVEAAIAALPPQIAAWLDEVPVIVEDRPAPADARGVGHAENSGEDAVDSPLGMYVGRGLGEERQSGELPPRVMIYRETLMNACATREQLAREIWKTLVHELGHHAGMDEEELESHGYGEMTDDDDIQFDVA